jgi:hypothetical protein
MIDARHTSQENESEILLKKLEKSVVFRYEKNYRLDLLCCMREILKLQKNDFPPFSDQKKRVTFCPKKGETFCTLF